MATSPMSLAHDNHVPAKISSRMSSPSFVPISDTADSLLVTRKRKWMDLNRPSHSFNTPPFSPIWHYDFHQDNLPSHTTVIDHTVVPGEYHQILIPPQPTFSEMPPLESVERIPNEELPKKKPRMRLSMAPFKPGMSHLREIQNSPHEHQRYVQRGTVVRFLCSLAAVALLKDEQKARTFFQHAPHVYKLYKLSKVGYNLAEVVSLDKTLTLTMAHYPNIYSSVLVQKKNEQGVWWRIEELTDIATNRISSQ